MIEMTDRLKDELRQANRLYIEVSQRFPDASDDQKRRIAQLAETLGYTADDMHGLVTKLQGAVS